MTPASFLRALTPLGWLAAGIASLMTVALVLAGLGFRWDPFDLSRRRAERAEASAGQARADAAARSAEAEGQTGQVARLDAALVTARRLDTVTTRSTLEAKEADDADQPLADDRRDRLRAHDDELCRLAPELGGCAAPADPAGRRRPAL